MKMILTKEIRNIIDRNGPNRLYMVSDFAHLNNDGLVTRALSRLEKEGVLIRLSQGLYLYPTVKSSRHGVDWIIQPIFRTLFHSYLQKASKMFCGMTINRCKSDSFMPMRLLSMRLWGDCRICKIDLEHWSGEIIVDGMADIDVDINETEIFNP